MISRHDFATRLRLARALIARGAPPAPVHVSDQLDAAAADVSEALEAWRHALRLSLSGRAAS